MCLWNGDFLFYNGVDPMNFSFFMVGKRGAMDLEHKARYLILHLQDRRGDKKSLDKLKASTKQKVIVPTNFHDFIDQLNFYRGLGAIFLGTFSPVVSSLSDLRKKLMKFEEKLAIASIKDSTFFGGLGYATQQRIIGVHSVHALSDSASK